MKNLRQRILETLPEPQEYLLGFADLESLLWPAFSHRYAIVIGRQLNDGIIDAIESGPTAEYFALYESVNAELNATITRIAEILAGQQIAHLPIPATVAESELQGEMGRTLRYPFSHKMAATRAGLGWIGKTDLLVTRAFGPRLRLATVLTASLVGKAGKPVELSRCGNCRVCVERCPARAASGKPWNPTVDRDEYFNAFACRAKCRELAGRNLGRPLSICGICVSVCPLGRKGRN